MGNLSAITFLIALSIFEPAVTYSQEPSQGEKVAEGEYWEWQDGHPLKDTSQTWTIRRTQNGYVVDDKLPADRGAALLGVIGAASGSRMSPELREEYRSASTTTDIHIELTKDGTIRGLILNGKTLSEVKQVRVANCVVTENQISCKGREGAAHLKNSGQDELVYSRPCPLFFTPMLKQSKPTLGQAIPIKLAMLEEVKNKLQLSEVSGQLRSEGQDKLSIGEYTFDSEKYALTLDTRPAPRQIILWASAQGIVFAMEDSKYASGHRVMLSQYKKYTDF